MTAFSLRARHTAVKLTSVLVLAIGCAGAHAQASGSSKKDLVQRLLVVQQPEIEIVARRLAEQPAAQLAAGSQQILAQAVPVEKREEAAKQIDAELKKYLEAAVPIVRDKAMAAAGASIGPMLEEKFTEDELKQLVTFFESPVRKKYQQTMPEMNEALLKKLVGDSKSLVDPKLQAAQSNIKKILEAAAGRPLTPPNGASAPKAATKPSTKK